MNEDKYANSTMSFLDITYEIVAFLFIFCALQACISDQPHHMLSKATDGPRTFEP
jgi:hypothetical protein